MPYTLEVRVKTTLGLDVGMAHKIADLGLFAAECAFFAHGILRIYRKTEVTELRSCRWSHGATGIP